MKDAEVCPTGYEKVAGECIPLELKVTKPASDNSDVAIRRVLGFVKEKMNLSIVEDDDIPMWSTEYKKGYDTGHHDAIHKIRHILDQSGYYADI